MTAVLHAVAAFLLALVGYSGGAVLVASARRPRPTAWDLPVAVTAAVAGAALAPGAYGAWIALPVAVAGGAAVGAATGGVARLAGGRRTWPGSGDAAQRDARAPDAASGRRPDDEAADVPAHRRFLLRLGDYQGRITMGVLYFGLLAPFAAVSRLGEDPLRLEEHRTSYWRDRPSGRNGGLEQSLRKQF